MNIVLVGFMGSGKTAVGRRIAQRLGYAFLDTDQWIEQQLGCTIADLFAQKGEAYFRELETRLAGGFCKLDNHVISTGGGMLTSPGNPERLRAAGLTVFLNADPEEILQRLERDTRRPKLKEGELRETVERLLGERMPLYTASQVCVNTKGKSVNRVAGEVIALLATHGPTVKDGDVPPGTEGGKASTTPPEEPPAPPEEAAPATEKEPPAQKEAPAADPPPEE